MSDYGVIFPLWRDTAGPTWRAYTRHAFVEGLGDGSLPRPAFQSYLVQDYIFLIHFSRAWALAVTKADSVAEMRICAATVNALINEEIQLHIETCAAAGLSEKMLFQAEEAPENLAYTRYVMDRGHAGDLLDLLATLAPCVMGYGEIGIWLGPQSVETPYRSWIDTYASPDYQQICVDVGALIDAVVARTLGVDPVRNPRWSGLCASFTKATALEIDFWQLGFEAK